MGGLFGAIFGGLAGGLKGLGIGLLCGGALGMVVVFVIIVTNWISTWVGHCFFTYLRTACVVPGKVKFSVMFAVNRSHDPLIQSRSTSTPAPIWSSR